MVIAGLGPVGRPPPPPRRVGAPGFRLAEGAAAVSASAAPAALGGLLALQEAGQEEVRDREARRHGGQVLDVLSALQRALLDGAADGQALDRLESLVRRAPVPADPALAAIQHAILLRAAVEQARRRVSLRAADAASMPQTVAEG